jgi:mono/diheme cytochrome c family protein
VWKYPTLLSVLFLAAIPALAQDTQKPEQSTAAPEYKIPPEAVKEVNPVKSTPESLARGKKRYGYDCAMCHGADGSGKGDIGDFKVQPADYRDAKSLKDKTDGELFYIIKNGKGEMPAEGDRATTNQVWDMVNYVRSLAKKEPPAKPKDQAQ